jgi:hypothetical protein
VAEPTTASTTGLGALLATLIPRQGAGTAVLAIEESSATIGRTVVQLRGGVWWLDDLGSVTGSWIDGEPVREAMPLAPGSAVRLGSLEFVFSPHDRWEDSPAPEQESAPQPVAARTLPAPSFIMMESPPSPARPVRWLVAGVVLITIAILWFVLVGGSR